VGKAAADALFPVHAPIVEPIQPNGERGARVDPILIPAPGVSDPAAQAVGNALRRMQSTQLLAATTVRSEDAVGSNNWAVAPSRSASGKALLAGDPHLELTLPSIWYEVHLVVPDSLDVYGVTIPGAPGVVIGFNRALAWTFTNTGADVMDYYIEQVNDTVRPTSYLVDGVMRPLTSVTHVVRDNKGDELAQRHTFRSTHRGPLQKIGDQWISVRWTVLESQRDFEAFDAAARATNARELLDAMALSYGAPAQNMLVADTAGNIAIRSTGRYPIRPGDGRGDVFKDGTRSSNDWSGYWPVADYPQSFNPAQGFLASANQEPLDPRVQPRYLGSNWERPWRAMRINQLLRADSAVTPDAMRRYQSDPGSARADWFVPAFLAAAHKATDSQKLARARTLLEEWDRTYRPSNTRTLLFEHAMSELSRRLWDELRPDSTSRAPIPTDMMTAVLLRDSTSAWWDDRRTAAVETRDELLAQVLETALDRVIADRGEPDSNAWAWGSYRFANINHLLQLPALSRRRIPVQGGPATLWPSSGSGTHGPSWRMVVELSSTPRAWGTYPGGQSGNPLSRRYDDRIDQWSRGELDSLRVPRTPAELAPSHIISRLVLRPATNGAER
jgi:penicillin amidase